MCFRWTYSVLLSDCAPGSSEWRGFHFGTCFLPRSFHWNWGLSGFCFWQSWQVLLFCNVRYFYLATSLTCAPRCQFTVTLIPLRVNARVSCPRYPALHSARPIPVMSCVWSNLRPLTLLWSRVSGTFVLVSTCPGNGVAEEEGVNGRRHPSRHRCLWFLSRLNLSSRFHRPTPPPRRRLLTSSLVYQRLPRPSLSPLPASPSCHQSPSSCNLCLSPTPPTAVMSLAGHIAISTASFTPLSRTACYMPLLTTASSTPLSPTASAMSVSPTERATLMVPTPATSPTASATSPAPTSPLASPASYHGITTAASSTRKRSSLQSSTSRVPMQDTLLPFPFMTLAHHKRCFSLSSTPDPLAPQGKRPRFAISSLTMMYTSCFWPRPRYALLETRRSVLISLHQVIQSTLFLAHRGLLAVEVEALPSSSETR